MIYRREDVHQLGFSCPHAEVSEEPLVLTIDRFVEQLDLRVLHGRYSECGRGYYDPGVMLKVWFFAYCDRSWHCREEAERVRYDVRYRYFVGSQRPGFRTLNRFRHDHLGLLAGCFAALVRHCEELGLIDSSVVALDGTKLRANASGRKCAKDSLRQEIGCRLAQWRSYRQAVAAFPAAIGLITACINRYLINFRTKGVIRNKIAFAGSWI